MNTRFALPRLELLLKILEQISRLSSLAQGITVEMARIRAMAAPVLPMAPALRQRKLFQTRGSRG